MAHSVDDGPRRAVIDIGEAEFRRLGHALIDELADFLTSIPKRPVTPADPPQEVRSLIDAFPLLPDHGEEPGEVIASAIRLLRDHSLLNGHPRFFGYVTSSPAPIGMLGDLLASAINPNVGAWRLAPIATEIEAQAVRWIAELIGYPSDSGGLFLSGGNMANFVGFLAARAAAADWDVRAKGVADPTARPMRLYASTETHTWLQKAADLSGIGTDSIRWIPTDDALRTDVSALREALARDLAAGDLPVMVVGTAGSVSTGTVDPLVEIASVCKEADVWFHVDGAYGALAAAIPDPPSDLRSLALADSVAVDPHKWLYAPLEAGCLLVRNSEHLRNAFAYHPPYYHFGEEVTNYVDYGPQNSRGFRALKVWLALRQVGREGYAEMIAEDIRLSRRLHTAVGQSPELEPVTQALSISTFQFVPADLRSRVSEPIVAEYLNSLNQEVLERIQLSGEAFVSNAIVRGRYVLRACIVNFRTSSADVDDLPDIVVRLGRETDALLRPASGPLRRG